MKESIQYDVAECSLGRVLAARSGRGTCAIFLGDDSESLVEELRRRFPSAEVERGDANIGRVIAAIEAPRAGVDLPLDVRGTAFQLSVWDALRAIPTGATATYTEIAERIGAPGSARAVAGACAANTLSMAIPCHRVVHRDGSLSGYRWGVSRKRELLAREARAEG